MNYTEKYHLPQWEENDRVMRTDFNQMCASIESGINKTDSNSVQRDNALSERINTAQAAAEEKPYVIGTLDSHAEMETVELGFRPSALLISYFYSRTAYDGIDGKSSAALFTEDGSGEAVRIKNNGFFFYREKTFPASDTFCSFRYIAFR